MLGIMNLILSKKSKNFNILYSVVFLSNALSKDRKSQLLITIFVNIFASLSEMLMLALVIPFLNLLINPDSLKNTIFFKDYIINNNINEPISLITPLTLIFIVVIIIATSVRIYCLNLTLRSASDVSIDISSKLYNNILNQTFEEHIKVNSANEIAYLTSYLTKLLNSIIAFLTIFSSGLNCLTIIVLLLFVNSIATSFSILSIILIYLLISKNLSNKLVNYGKIVGTNSKLKVKYLQEGLNSIRDIILDNSYSIFLRKFRNTETLIRKNAIKIKFSQGFTKPAIEGLIYIFIAAFSCITIISTDNSTGLLAFLGVFGVGAKRLIPNIQKVYDSSVILKSNSPQVSKIIELLHAKKKTDINKIKINHNFFSREIRFENVFFKYSTSEDYVLEDINFQIRKGEKIGLVGKTGSGKSTLLDILMTFLSPSSGNIYLDGKSILNSKTRFYSWRALIAHVPQNIFLFDTTIEENITMLSTSEINSKKLKRCLDASQLNNLISNSSNGIKTKIGERGKLLSGGEIQRIAIARALYRDSKVLIFDEATSALDKQTEKDIMESINYFDKDITIISVAHRISSLSNFDRIYKIANKNLKQI